MANRGLKRICASCGIKFYDMEKQPIKCPACDATFTGDIEVKSRRSRSTIVPDTVKRDEIEEKNKATDDDEDEEDETVSLEELVEDDDDENADSDDLSDLEGDIVVTSDNDKD